MAVCRRNVERNLAPGGRRLSDPFRGASLRFLEELQDAGWAVTTTTWSLGEEETLRPFGVFELAPPVL